MIEGNSLFMRSLLKSVKRAFRQVNFSLDQSCNNLSATIRSAPNQLLKTYVQINAQRR